jgi:hypothetical protein
MVLIVYLKEQQKGKYHIKLIVSQYIVIFRYEICIRSTSKEPSPDRNSDIHLQKAVMKQ